MAEEENKNEEPEVVAAAAETPTEAPAPEAAAEKAAPEAPKGAPVEGDATGGEEAPVKKTEEKRDIFAELLGEESPDKVKVHKSKKSKNVVKGIVHVVATFNNTIVSVTDERGNSIGWSSAGKMGFRGSRKSTAYAACRQAMAHGLKEVDVRVKGPGAGRESAVRAVQTLGVDVHTIEDVTAIPHNGCRPKKARRV